MEKITLLTTEVINGVKCPPGTEVSLAAGDPILAKTKELAKTVYAEPVSGEHAPKKRPAGKRVQTKAHGEPDAETPEGRPDLGPEA